MQWIWLWWNKKNIIEKEKFTIKRNILKMSDSEDGINRLLSSSISKFIVSLNLVHWIITTTTTTSVHTNKQNKRERNRASRLFHKWCENKQVRFYKISDYALRERKDQKIKYENKQNSKKQIKESKSSSVTTHFLNHP